ncbi:head-tail connector protein [Luteibacter sp. NPDC031894]|uniref:head-tail connector protein n=1 Tax=Luteibacter sp. NPDC031894 TaxID=3390572 RepID=UPI003D059F5D
MADTPLVTMDQARAHIRADADEDISVYVGAAVIDALEFLNRGVFATPEDLAAAVLAGTAGDDPMVVNDAIRAAILLRVGQLFKDRESGALPLGSRTLLQPYRVGLGV